MAKNLTQTLLIGMFAVGLVAALGWALFPDVAETQSQPADAVSLNTAMLDDEAPSQAAASPLTVAPAAV